MGVEDRVTQVRKSSCPPVKRDTVNAQTFSKDSECSSSRLVSWEWGGRDLADMIRKAFLRTSMFELRSE